MARVSRSSSLKSSRYKLQHTKNINNPEMVRRVEPLDETKKMKNHTEHPSEHYLAFYDNYYESIKELKEEFRNFYHDERALRKTVDSFEDSNNTFELNMMELIKKYNNALQSLMKLDDATKSDHTYHVKESLAKYHPILQKYGIHETSDGFIDLDCKMFQEVLANGTGDVQSVFAPLKEVILLIHRCLYSIKIPKKRPKNQYEQKTIDMRGLFIEKKL